MLLTKLHKPSPGKNLVHRSSLLDKLDEGLNRKLILISAPAGFGKTTLILDWIDKHKIPAAWFSLDGGDNDPGVFLSYIISGIQSIKKEFGQSALKLLKSANKPASESITALLINDILEINQDFLLVLDDFHLINSIEVLQLVAFLLEHIPGNIHIVMATRSDPTLPLARLRSQHQLVELRSAELSFSANDISNLFNKKLKFKLSTEDIYSLESKTEGWISGLQLAALSMQGHDNASAFIEAFAGNNRYIMDYLIEEVLKIQSAEVKEFLLKTSILSYISAPLCNAVLGRNDSQIILEELEKNNMFIVPLDEKRQSYRYHHLFADLLKQRLLFQDKSSIEELHNKACEWFEQNNMFDFAIEHALEINNHEKSIQILEEVVEEMWKNGQHSAILRYGDLLPDEFIKKSAEFCLYYSWILIAAGQIKKAEPFLTSAEIITKKVIGGNNSSQKGAQYSKKLLGKIAVAFAYLYSHEEHTEKIFDYCKIAMEHLSENDPLWFSWAWFSYGIAYLSSGEIIESNEAFEKALVCGKKSGNIYLITTIVLRLAENEQQLGHYKSAYTKCSNLLTLLKDKGYAEISKTEWAFAALYFNLGITHFMWAELDEAYENIKIAYNLCKSGKDIYLKIFILMFYTFMLLNRGDKEAVAKINELEDIIKQNQIPPFLLSMFIGWKMYVLIHTKQIDQASSIISEYGLELDKKKTHANEAAYSAYARLLLAQNKLDDAEFLLSELYTIANEGERIERLIEIKISMAIMHNKKGNHDLGVTNLMEAMELASDENLISMFVYNIEDIIDLLKDLYKIQATTINKISNEFILKFKLMIEKMQKRISIVSNSDLSTRELDTLKLVAENLSNQEIADKLFISMNTVKTHLKNINLKLEVDNRVKAAAKAKKLGIV